MTSTCCVFVRRINCRQRGVEFRRIGPIRLLAIRLANAEQALAVANPLPMRLEDEQQVAVQRGPFRQNGPGGSIAGSLAVTAAPLAAPGRRIAGRCV